jgi:hypothetical protein
VANASNALRRREIGANFGEYFGGEEPNRRAVRKQLPRWLQNIGGWRMSEAAARQRMEKTYHFQ